jgi:hypothetical protein
MNEWYDDKKNLGARKSPVLNSRYACACAVCKRLEGRPHTHTLSGFPSIGWVEMERQPKKIKKLKIKN